MATFLATTNGSPFAYGLYTRIFIPIGNGLKLKVIFGNV